MTGTMEPYFEEALKLQDKFVDRMVDERISRIFLTSSLQKVFQGGSVFSFTEIYELGE